MPQEAYNWAAPRLRYLARRAIISLLVKRLGNDHNQLWKGVSRGEILLPTQSGERDEPCRTFM